MASRGKWARWLPYIFGNQPRLFYPVLKLYRDTRYRRRAWQGTEITIEGFPRSGNSFAVSAFKLAQQRSTVVAHHLHVPAQIVQSAHLGLPTCLLIRAPEDTIRSLRLKYPLLPINSALLGYAVFYEQCFIYRHHCIIARFDQVVSDFGLVIDRINDKFGTRFARFEHTAANVQQVYAQLDRRAPKADGGMVFGSFRPRPEKEKHKADILLARHTKLLRRCTAIYRRFKAER